ncbi:ABC-type uncharacterized transport system, substrate-binding protein [Enhydrobacter aerosaccus]|uniref:ABC-type uncharacterized transport system, substrate-binding protein n=1 Tax=Enhydrobacter aerosaccus TaxID=225324 RepID=A0A1T4L484_9HYPH|nr:DUF1007 family protein [Enhydrobacter aerosaccus]SJZ49526.1 ABC-type uncharacterized transport system, substrate-binding protein [Enhydrobacter aerosaccus]
MTLRTLLLAVIALLLPMAASAHPHIWMLQRVKPIVTDGKFTAVEIEWRFDPTSSENEIAVIDENKDGRFSPDEVKRLADDTLQALEKSGFMTWLNVGGKDFQPKKEELFDARIEDPATFAPAEWDRTAGDKDTATSKPEAQKVPPQKPRNLVYTIRLALPQPVKAFTITTYDPEDFIRVDVGKGKLPQDCKLGKHPSYKSEFIPGQPVFADTVSCKLP